MSWHVWDSWRHQSDPVNSRQGLHRLLLYHSVSLYSKSGELVARTRRVACEARHHSQISKIPIVYFHCTTHSCFINARLPHTSLNVVKFMVPRPFSRRSGWRKLWSRLQCVLSILDRNSSSYGIRGWSGRARFARCSNGGGENIVVNIHQVRGGGVGVVCIGMRFSQLCDS